MTNVIVADDDPEVRRFLRLILKREGYYVMVGRDGNDVLELADERKIDAIITDVIMPRKDGIEAIAQVKERYPKVRIIAISGGGQKNNEDFLKSAEMMGANYTIAKPFEANEILEVLKKALTSDLEE